MDRCEAEFDSKIPVEERERGGEGFSERERESRKRGKGGVFVLGGHRDVEGSLHLLQREKAF